jgi:S1-C subfamily serine protease
MTPSTQRAPLAHRLGLQVVDLTVDLASLLGSTGSEGVVLTRIEPGSPAASAGLRVGSVLSKVGDRAVCDARQFWRALREQPQGLLQGEMPDRTPLLVTVGREV